MSNFGYETIVIWEHEIRNKLSLDEKIAYILAWTEQITMAANVDVKAVGAVEDTIITQEIE